ncbi:MAG: hypothetical protein JXQ27_17640 [Acidobacteria bacterium]|nr:hypothetical protein [Acidobacteriota bacterium]
MIKPLPIITCLVLLIFCVAPLAGDTDVEYDVSLGYHFLFSTESNEFYRNHADLSEGFLVDGFHFVISPRTNERWFDQVNVDACLANRLDSSKSVRFDMVKHGRYAMTVRYDFLYDFFLNDAYNYGANQRNLERSNLRVDFDWKSVDHFIFSVGYRYGKTAGSYNQPESGWGDIFKIPFDRDYTHEEIRGGLTYTNRGFTAAFHQSWIRIEDNSRYEPDSIPGYGFGGHDLEATVLTREGLVKSTIPASTFKAGYAQEIFSTDFTYVYRGGDIENNLLDLKGFYFVDFNQRSDLMARLMATADIPEHQATFRADVSPVDRVNIEYEFYWNRMETDSAIDVTHSLILAAHTNTPIEYSEINRDLFFYRDDYKMHTFTGRVYPVRDLSLWASYARTDGELINTYTRTGELLTDITSDYSYAKVFFGGKYRLPGGTELSGEAGFSDIEHPDFRTAGTDKTEFKIQAYQPFNDKLNFNFGYQESELEDDAIHLENKVKLLDLGMFYRPRQWAMIGAGFTRLSLDYSMKFQYYELDTLVSPVESYATDQNGFYLTAGFTGHERIRGSASLFYLDDSGSSFPLSRWSTSIDLEIGLVRRLSARLSARYYDYNEDFFARHDYSFNQLAVTLRWTNR